MFGELYHIPKQDTNTEMAEVLSIYNEIVKLKQLGLLNAKFDDQSKIDEILISMALFFRNSDKLKKGKDVCSLSALVSVTADSMMEPKSGIW
jgi:hypothetical protein